MPAEAGEKTEPATPRRRNEARGRGQVARSQDLVAAVLLLAGLVTLRYMGPDIWNGMGALLVAALDFQGGVQAGDTVVLSVALFLRAAVLMLPFFVIIAISAIVISYLQIGWLFTFSPVRPAFGKLDPIQGLQRLLSARSMMATAIGVGKVLIILFVAYGAVWGALPSVVHAANIGAVETVSLCGQLVFSIGVRAAIALLALGLLDWWWQRHRFERDLRMTKEEVKDELRSMEGDPVVKRRQRQLQMQLATQRLRRDVPRADVVVTNPTHYAVALAYDSETMPAPKLIAKGADELALRIREIAKEFGVPIVERKPLARALYETVQVGHFIPEEFYRAIAELLAYVYELSGRIRKGTLENASLAT